MASPPTGTVTFLFTDIEGSTRMWEHDAPAMQEALARHERILRDAIVGHGGYVFKTVGDAFCAAFPTASDALEATLEAQRTLLSEQWQQTGPLRVRIALHTGAAEERAGDYFGPPVNRVARLLSAAHGGQVLLSLPAQELVRDQLPGGAGLMDLGERRLKDLFRPERIFQLSAPGLPSEFPPLKTLDAYRNNLPLQPTPLVGREKEVAAVRERLVRPEVRLLTLTGAGGTGKTRLGLQTAAELTQEFEDGVFFVSLAAISDPGLVIGAVAGELGVKEAGERPLMESLEDYLREKQMLLLLDNFEQVLEAAPMVSGLLSAAPDLKVMATSRIPLGLYGEHEYAVPPLALPDRRQPPSVESLTQYEAVRLFVERARAAKADFSVTNENAPAVAEICHRLDGLPLAIELAAARVRILPPKALLKRLSDRLKLLTGGARDLPIRQKTLRRTIDWSYDLLKEVEKTLFGRLSVFSGGSTLEAVEEICDPVGEIDALQRVESLVEKSLLRQEERIGGEPRFYMLETVLEYALEKLEGRAEADEVRRRHAGYYLAMAEEAEPELEGPQQAEWFERIEAEYDNFRTALSRALEQNEVELSLRLAGALRPFWLSQGYFGEGRRWLEDLLAKDGHALVATRVKALEALSWLADWQEDTERAEAAAEEGLRLSAQAEVGSRIKASLRGMMGDAALARGDYERAEEWFEEGLALCRETADKRTSVWLLGGMTNLALGQGDHQHAERLFDEAVPLAQELGDALTLGAFLNGLGYVHVLQGDAHRAMTVSEEAVTLLREHGYRGMLNKAIDTLAWAAFLCGDRERAEALHREGLALCKDLGDRAVSAAYFEGLACEAATAGEARRSATLLGAAEASREATGFHLTPGEQALHEPYVRAARSRLDEASWEEAWAEGRAMSYDEIVSYAMETEEAGG